MYIKLILKFMSNTNSFIDTAEEVQNSQKCLKVSHLTCTHKDPTKLSYESI